MKELSETERDKAILNLASHYLTIKDCKKCGYPRIEGYYCIHCGSYNPDETYEEEAERG